MVFPGSGGVFSGTDRFLFSHHSATLETFEEQGDHGACHAPEDDRVDALELTGTKMSEKRFDALLGVLGQGHAAEQKPRAADAAEAEEGGATGAGDAAAKGAITSGLLMSLKNDVSQIGGVRVNAVAPGWTVTPKKVEQGVDEGLVERATATMALKKLATPEDVASAVVMLASDEISGHITGQVIEVAGGMEGRLIP